MELKISHYTCFRVIFDIFYVQIIHLYALSEIRIGKIHI